MAGSTNTTQTVRKSPTRTRKTDHSDAQDTRTHTHIYTHVVTEGQKCAHTHKHIDTHAYLYAATSTQARLNHTGAAPDQTDTRAGMDTPSN